MLGTLVTIGLLLSGVLATIIWPVHLPGPVLTMLDVFYRAIWGWQGYLPIDVFMNDLAWFVTVMVAVKIFNIAVGLMALVNGAGKPEL